MTFKRIKTRAGLLATLGAVAVLSTGTIGSAVAAGEVRQGVIEAVGSGNVVVIDDKQFVAGSDTQIHGSRGSGRSALSKGQQVEYEYEVKNGQRVLTNIWLPGARK